MSTKTLRVCDRTEEGKECNKPYLMTCVLCDTECCSAHAGGDLIKIALTIGASGPLDETVLGQVCYRCRSLQSVAVLGTVQRVLKDQHDALITAIKAAIAAHALRNEKKP